MRAVGGPRLLAAWVGGAAVVAAAGLVAPTAGASTPAATAGSFTVALAQGRSVQVDDLSSWSSAQLTPFVQWADRGMATTDPLHQKAVGEMETGDRVVVTPAGIYWLDVTRRGGLLSGVWPLTAAASGAPAWVDAVNVDDWEPNTLLPGANASSAAIYDAGQSVLVVPVGGSDGSCTAGSGTFVLGNSGNCGVAATAVPANLTTGGSNGDHTYSFTGTLYQEGTNHDQVLTDTAGDRATMAFNLTYHFRDATALGDGYGSADGPADQRVRTELTLTPSSTIQLATLVVAGDSDQGGASYPTRSWDYSNVARYYAYPNQLAVQVAGYQAAQICEGSGCAGSDYMTEAHTIPATMAAGDFVTEVQTSTTTTAAQRQLTYMLPPTTAYRLPERIDHIWNAGLNVSSLGLDWFNGESVTVTPTTPLQLGFDLETAPHPAGTT